MILKGTEMDQYFLIWLEGSRNMGLGHKGKKTKQTTFGHLYYLLILLIYQHHNYVEKNVIQMHTLFHYLF